jgi:putative ABC transport system permease protein
VPLQQRYVAGFTNIVTRSASGQSVGNEVRALVRSMNPNVPLGVARAARDITSLGLLPQRIAMSTAGSLGVVGLLLAAIGLYGVTAYAVARRTREFGVRIALGATRGDIVGLVLRRGMRLTLAGSAVGLLLAAGAGRLAASSLFGVAANDPLTFAGSALLFAVVSLAACYLPARRATRISAIDALRAE